MSVCTPNTSGNRRDRSGTPCLKHTQSVSEVKRAKEVRVWAVNGRHQQHRDALPPPTHTQPSPPGAL